MRFYTIKFSMYVRAVFAVCLFLINSSAIANGREYKPGEVYVIINNSNENLLQLFKIIEKQTVFSFAYDENDVNLSKKLTLIIGTYLLKDLLIIISKQTRLQFIQNGNIILVSGDRRDRTEIIKVIIPVKGVVKDAAGIPLIGVTVSVKGSSLVVQTDREGNFSLDVADNAVLIITYVGYKKQEVNVNGQSALLITMEEASNDLNEVVVVGYQTRRRGDLSGSLSVVNVGGISKLPVLSVDQALAGKVPGVRITQNTGQPGDGVVVRIRGVGTINDNNPLFIVDGIPTKDGINFLSANDIESIVVLKDASSAAIYGARAANGVVLITTKSGKRGKPQFNYSGYGGFQSPGTLTKMANTAEYVEVYNEAAEMIMRVLPILH